MCVCVCVCEYPVLRPTLTDGRPSEGSLKKLDGSVKKNSTFVKKLVCPLPSPPHTHTHTLASFISWPLDFIQRTLTEQQRSQLTSDFKALNLSKYIQEAVSLKECTYVPRCASPLPLQATSIAEAKLKVGDVGCAVHLCSLLHLSYADFTGQLLEQLQRVYSVSGGNLKVEDKVRCYGIDQSMLIYGSDFYLFLYRRLLLPSIELD